MSSYTIERMSPSDWPQVRQIYADGLATGQASFETEAPVWETWDARHHPELRLVARSGENILGWAAVTPVSPRPCYRGVGEVSVYVHQDHRGQGLGEVLLKALVEGSEAQGFWTLWASIFPENQASVSLHLRHGFRLLGRRERIAQHYGVWRDTVILERRSRRVGV